MPALIGLAVFVAILLGLVPKFGALIQAIPLPVTGGVSISKVKTDACGVQAAVPNLAVAPTAPKATAYSSSSTAQLSFQISVAVSAIVRPSPPKRPPPTSDAPPRAPAKALFQAMRARPSR